MIPIRFRQSASDAAASGRLLKNSTLDIDSKKAAHKGARKKKTERENAKKGVILTAGDPSLRHHLSR